MTTFGSWLGGVGGIFGGGGCGASALRPCGVNGVITIKMMSNTSSTSISGVTFMSTSGPAFLPPTAIDIMLYSFFFYPKIVWLRDRLTTAPADYGDSYPEFARSTDPIGLLPRFSANRPHFRKLHTGTAHPL